CVSFYEQTTKPTHLHRVFLNPALNFPHSRGGGGSGRGGGERSAGEAGGGGKFWGGGKSPRRYVFVSERGEKAEGLHAVSSTGPRDCLPYELTTVCTTHVKVYLRYINR